ncbi:MAG: TlyA family RNA methyltransferase [Pseudomonadota bacterium]
MTSKKRLDILLVEHGLAETRQKAQALILAGQVQVDGKLSDKSGVKISEESTLSIHNKNLPYVSRGGLKLEAALDHFQVNISGLSCLDVGASTGGFTDCLLQRGAHSVVCVDVGYGQLHWKIRNDPRVTVLERTNIRYLADNSFSIAFDIAVIDVSFISLKIVIPKVFSFIRQSGHMIALIKPQFEVGKGEVGKGGVVRNPEQHDKVLKDLSCFFKNHGLVLHGILPSPILGPKGNKEFLAYLSPFPYKTGGNVADIILALFNALLTSS